MKDPKYDYGEDEELHVMITGDNQDDVSNVPTVSVMLLHRSVRIGLVYSTRRSCTPWSRAKTRTM